MPKKLTRKFISAKSQKMFRLSYIMRAVKRHIILANSVDLVEMVLMSCLISICPSLQIQLFHFLLIKYDKRWKKLIQDSPGKKLYKKNDGYKGLKRTFTFFEYYYAIQPLF